MTEIEKLKKEIEAIKARNARVERDKTWETSWVRRMTIAILTYLTIVIFFLVIKVDKPFLNATVPTIAFLISTASVNILKNWWLAKKRN